MLRNSRFSLLGLLGLVFVACFAVSAFCMGGVVADLFVALVAILVFASVIASFVSHGARCSASRGFALPVAAYVLLVGLLGQRELAPGGIFPSTKFIRVVYNALGGNADAYYAAQYGGGMYGGDMYGGGGYVGGYGGGGYVGGYGGGGYGGGIAAPKKLARLADPQTFFLVGHTVVCLILGYFGAQYALLESRKPAVQEADEH